MNDEAGSAAHGPARFAHATQIDDPDANRRGLSSHTRHRIGSHLRTMYDTVVQQPVPDRFKELIERLGQEIDGTP